MSYYNFDAPNKLGNDLTPEEQEEVKRAYVHRYTGQHKPEWAHKLMPNGKQYQVQHKDDADWLAHTRFNVTKKGRLHRGAHSCHSTPTWPGGVPKFMQAGVKESAQVLVDKLLS